MMTAYDDDDDDDTSVDISHLGASIMGDDGDFSLRAKSGTMDETSMDGEQPSVTAGWTKHYYDGAGACWGFNTKVAGAIIDDETETAASSTGGDPYRQHMSVFEQDVRQPTTELSPPPSVDGFATTSHPSYCGVFTNDEVRGEPQPPSSLEDFVRDKCSGKEASQSDADTEGGHSITPSILRVYSSKSDEKVLANKLYTNLPTPKNKKRCQCSALIE